MRVSPAGTGRPWRTDAVLGLQARLTDRDETLLGWLADHHVLTTPQITRALFGSTGFAQRRLLTLHRAGLIDRFRPLRPGGGAYPWHYVLAHLGALHVAAVRDQSPPRPAATADRIRRIATSRTLDHRLGVNGFFTDLAGHARTHPGTRLERWWSEAQCAAPGAFAPGLISPIRPDGHGIWTETDSDGRPRRLAFFLVLKRSLVLDGELVALDERGRPSFGRLQERMHVRDPAAVRRLAGRVPVFYYVFDLLRLDDRPLLQLPYTERRALLDDLELDAATWRLPPSFPGPATDVMAASAQHGLEGIVAKRRASTYRPGQRSPDWRKVKHQRMQEVVIAGWRPGRGRRAGGIGSLILGVPDKHGDLQHAGGVGTGFTDRMLHQIAERLAPLRQDASPFPTPFPRAETRDAIWVRPDLVGEVAYTEWTGDGHLRHPSWRGLRPDKDPRQVHRE